MERVLGSGRSGRQHLSAAPEMQNHSRKGKSARRSGESVLIHHGEASFSH